MLIFILGWGLGLEITVCPVMCLTSGTREKWMSVPLLCAINIHINSYMIIFFVLPLFQLLNHPAHCSYYASVNQYPKGILNNNYCNVYCKAYTASSASLFKGGVIACLLLWALFASTEQVIGLLIRWIYICVKYVVLLLFLFVCFIPQAFYFLCSGAIVYIFTKDNF